ncbi:hypothetical protein LIER_27661 [Lithospermum erythrorhizon]|uniref:Uncharacterized protein n=1 Tax=Lithospermum erythrorhizon TaxID=34254 RepID=A0AAV3RIT0_LITER
MEVSIKFVVLVIRTLQRGRRKKRDLARLVGDLIVVRMQQSFEVVFPDERVLVGGGNLCMEMVWYLQRLLLDLQAAICLVLTNVNGGIPN